MMDGRNFVPRKCDMKYCLGKKLQVRDLYDLESWNCIL